MLSKVGLDAWNAPEMLNLGYYNEKVDLWGVGTILYYMLTGEQPFLQEMVAKLHQDILTGKVNYEHPNIKACSSDCKDLLRRLFDTNPETRISASEALDHNFFKAK
mmetsp:Transcript_16384/g.15713  ORF Transcript_16384/g.15713 Transcript_16384/m.15713 type:complete len:106 (-) Transcript_16384:581-898(-)|eukprot:CAMPEP_0170544752 /NCGR_PEP_ID=MMETSP0211-20121228/3393_1 /TAXON_ID=311385 /ORGANISM="Pseudokeronopsis sp., Strain OXSARD2" /LENGTH=105 /DNA_ID=CAMNT_0010848479 /DNA_START=883 /DNA_END=1200 /DNA_ORIENTATION=-